MDWTGSQYSQCSVLCCVFCPQEEAEQQDRLDQMHSLAENWPESGCDGFCQDQDPFSANLFHNTVCHACGRMCMYVQPPWQSQRVGFNMLFFICLPLFPCFSLRQLLCDHTELVQPKNGPNLPGQEALKRPTMLKHLHHMCCGCARFVQAEGGPPLPKF